MYELAINIRIADTSGRHPISRQGLIVCMNKLRDLKLIHCVTQCWSSGWGSRSDWNIPGQCYTNSDLQDVFLNKIFIWALSITCKTGVLYSRNVSQPVSLGLSF